MHCSWSDDLDGVALCYSGERILSTQVSNLATFAGSSCGPQLHAQPLTSACRRLCTLSSPTSRCMYGRPSCCTSRWTARFNVRPSQGRMLNAGYYLAPYSCEPGSMQVGASAKWALTFWRCSCWGSSALLLGPLTSEMTCSLMTRYDTRYSMAQLVTGCMAGL